MPDFSRRTLETAEILEILPHRPPFLLVDRIIDLEPGRKAVGVKAISMGEPFFDGHFPGHPVMPAVLIAEAMAQVGGVLLLTIAEHRGKLAYFAGIDKMKFRKPVLPGDLLVSQIELITARGHIGKVKAVAYVFRMQTSQLDCTVAEGTPGALPRNGITFVSRTDPERQREKKLLMGSLEGDLAAEGEMMFALMNRTGETGGAI